MSDVSAQNVSLGTIIRSMKLDPQGCFKMGRDGVFRSFDGAYDRNVVDAVGLSPSHIKELLDRQEWSQETEDTFRGVDGRKVVDNQALFHPPDDDRPPKYTEEDKVRVSREIAELNRKMLENIEREKKEGVNVEEKYACNRRRANYNLDPRPE